MFGKCGRKWKPLQFSLTKWELIEWRNDSSVGEEVFNLSFSGHQQNPLVNVNVATKLHGDERKDKRRAKVSGVKMECVNIPIIGALNSAFFEVWPRYTEQYIGQTHSQTARVYRVAVYSSENWLFTSDPFTVYCFENVVYRSVYGAMLCNVDSLDLFIQGPRLMFPADDKSRPACLLACLRNTRQSPTSEISLEHVCIVMFDVRQHLYGDFVFKDTFIQLSLMVQLDMSGTQRMIATCAIRAHLCPILISPALLLSLADPPESIHNNCTCKLGLEPRLYTI